MTLFHCTVNRSIRIYWEVLSAIEQSIYLHCLSIGIVCKCFLIQGLQAA